MRLLQTRNTIPQEREKKGSSTLSKQVQLIKVSGLGVSAMDTGSRCGLTGQDTRASGEIIERMDMESSFMLMEIYTRATGSTIKLMVLVLIFM